MKGLTADFTVARDRFTLDFAIEIGGTETVALLGPNGAGKSTAVAALAGLLAIDSGSIALGGRTLDDADRTFVTPAARRIGVVFQDYLLFDHMTVSDNIAFGAEATGGSPSSIRQRVDDLAADLELGPILDARPTKLSGGQAQRVALARALATEPDLLLLDEPLAALDVETRSSTRRLLARRLEAFDGPRLLITHDPTDAFLLAERIYVIEGGRITQSGDPARIREHPATPYVAAVAGTNLLRGRCAAGVITLAGSDHTLQTADTGTNGDVLITIHPRAISLYAEQPHGSPRNTWLTTVASIEPLGDTTRILLGDPLPVAADITPASTRALGLSPGSAIWASVKATEIAISR